MTPTVSYVPGRRLALGGLDTWLFLERSLDARVLDVLWPAVRDGVSVWELAHAILAINDEEGLPDFGLVRVEGVSARVLLRGRVRAVVDGQELAAQQLETWLEVVVPRPSRLMLSAQEVDPEPVSLPWSSGVTLADALLIDFSSSSAVAPASAVPPSRSHQVEGGAAAPAELPILVPDDAATGASSSDDVAADVHVGRPRGDAEDAPAERSEDRPAALSDGAGEAGAPPAVEPDPSHVGRARGKYDHVQEDSITADAAVAAERAAAAELQRDVVDPPATPDVLAGVPVESAGPVLLEKQGWPADHADAPADLESDEWAPATPIMIMEVPSFGAPVTPATSEYDMRAAVTPYTPLPPRDDDRITAGAAGILRLPNGDAVVLDRAVVLGRDPVAPAGREQDPPHLIKLANPERDISSTHLEVRPDGEHVLLVDLSRNGTHVALPGRDAERLPSEEPVPVPPGTRIYLNDTVVITIERPG